MFSKESIYAIWLPPLIRLKCLKSPHPFETGRPSKSFLWPRLHHTTATENCKHAFATTLSPKFETTIPVRIMLGSTAQIFVMFFLFGAKAKPNHFPPKHHSRPPFYPCRWPCATIFEDDVLLAPNFRQRLAETAGSLPPFVPGWSLQWIVFGFLLGVFMWVFFFLLTHFYLTIFPWNLPWWYYNDVLVHDVCRFLPWNALYDSEII